MWKLEDKSSEIVFIYLVFSCGSWIKKDSIISIGLKIQLKNDMI